jgi:hypothetical protein
LCGGGSRAERDDGEYGGNLHGGQSSGFDGIHVLSSKAHASLEKGLSRPGVWFLQCFSHRFGAEGANDAER